MNCPVCLQTQLVMSERSGIEIDYCPSCRGVWLDRGELDKIVERAQTADTPAGRPAYQAPQGQPHYEQQHRGNGPIPQPGPPPENNLYWDGYRWKRKKGWLEEIFD